MEQLGRCSWLVAAIVTYISTVGIYSLPELVLKNASDETKIGERSVITTLCSDLLVLQISFLILGAGSKLVQGIAVFTV
ncbi:hypothetical protein BDD12DRAFT_830380 [Trichophaea hybrida]|nr:hypothetical protein BDD12DRAFT_830380 [Trichophaea hybrida]